KRGSRHEISFTRAEMKLIESAWMSHNHPSGNSFSPSDIQLLMDANLAQIRAVGRKSLHQIYVHSAWATEKLLRHTPAEVEQWIDKRVKEQEYINARLILRHKLNRFKAEVNLDHEVIQEAAMHFGFGYSRRRLK